VICPLDGQPYNRALFADDGLAILEALRATGANVPAEANANPSAWLLGPAGVQQVKAFQVKANINNWGPYGNLPWLDVGKWTDGKMGACTLRSLAAAVGRA
jgi:hypothetical protein